MTIEKRNLLLSVTGQGVSLFGSAIYTFALGLYVLNTTGSGFSFAMTLVMGILPVILINPFAGVIADRFDKRRTVVLSDAASALLMVGLYLFTQRVALTLPLIYITTFVLTGLTQVLSITFEAAKPALVGREIPVVRLNSLNQVVFGLSAILGPVLGGLVYAFIDIRMFILINGISFACSSLSEVFIDFHFNAEAGQSEDARRAGVFADIREGFAYLVSRRDLMEFLTLFVVGNFFLSGAIGVGLPALINLELGLGGTQYGLIQGMFPVGLILGAVLVERLCRRLSIRRLVYLSMVGISLLIGLLGLTPRIPGIPALQVGFLVGIAVLFGIGITLVDVPTMTYTQTEVPARYLGRVMSIRHSLIKLVNPVAYLLAGWLIGPVSAATVMMVSSAVFTLILLLSVRRFMGSAAWAQ